jgi:hypothetical protein
MFPSIHAKSPIFRHVGRIFLIPFMFLWTLLYLWENLITCFIASTILYKSTIIHKIGKRCYRCHKIGNSFMYFALKFWWEIGIFMAFVGMIYWGSRGRNIGGFLGDFRSVWLSFTKNTHVSTISQKY